MNICLCSKTKLSSSSRFCWWPWATQRTVCQRVHFLGSWTFPGTSHRRFVIVFRMLVALNRQFFSRILTGELSIPFHRYSEQAFNSQNAFWKLPCHKYHLIYASLISDTKRLAGTGILLVLMVQWPVKSLREAFFEVWRTIECGAPNFVEFCSKFSWKRLRKLRIQWKIERFSHGRTTLVFSWF